MVRAGSPEPDVRIHWDAPIEMDDGAVLRADVFRPTGDGRYPVLMTHGPYGKGLSFQQGFAGMWRVIETKYPEIPAGSSNRYQNWETVDPEKWVSDGYVCVRVDSRGAGRSPGFLDPLSAQETRDFYQCIEWAGTQPWSNGKVGLLGISYYAMNQWQVAALRPPHLAAICPWEGASDFYRDVARHGGILHTFVAEWFPAQVLAVQHGVGINGPVNPSTGELVAGPPTLSEKELADGRADLAAQIRARQLDDDWYQERSAALEQITVPVLSAANWAHALHTRGNFEGYARAGSAQKWLEVHGLEHYAEFYTDYGVALQKRFFGHFLAGRHTGWNRQAPVHLRIRRADGSFADRDEQEWPLARTRWTKLFLHPPGGSLSPEPQPRQGAAVFSATGEGRTFTTPPLTEETEITGPAAAKLFVSSSTADADVFVVLRVLDPGGKDVTFVSGLDPAGVIATGWLRASHRKLDPGRSLPYRPWHTHDQPQPLTPGEPAELDVEIWPTSVIVPRGYRIAVTISGHDFQFPGPGPWPQVYGIEMKGLGIFLHNDPNDRRPEIFAGTTTIHSGGQEQSYLLLPVIPPPGPSRDDGASAR
jgi:predicted acyl esterase